MAKKTHQKKHVKSEKEAMELVDVYYIPKEIAPHYRLLREHCANEVVQVLQNHFIKVERKTLDEEVGEVILAYRENNVQSFCVELSPIMISKLEKEISANRLEKFLLEN